MSKSFQKGDILELTVEDLAYGARGVARTDDFVWFVERGIPGQRVRTRIARIRKSYGEAYVQEVLEPSPHQINPPCPYFGTCGGCQLQHLAYEVQAQAKAKQIQDILNRIGGIENVSVQPTTPAEQIYAYRNKMEFTFSNRRWLFPNESGDKPKDFALGLHVPRRYDKVLDIDACLLQSEQANQILRDIKQTALESGLPPYGIRTHEGFWRFLVIREGKNTGDLMLNLLTTNQAGEEGSKTVENMAKKLLKDYPAITTFVHSITDKKAQVAFGDSERILIGEGKITEKIGGSTFEISPNAFFQTNSYQTQHLFDAIAESADLKGDETLYDLYCGTGAIGIFLADKVKHVLGIEVIESAVRDAKRNAALNGIKNVEFVIADMKDALKELDTITSSFGAPDVVILDPPRGGTHPKTVKHLLRLAAPKVVYVSCNPAILARDLQILCEKTYSLQTIQPVDMFPHTGHIEVVALLTKNS